jgi:Rieske Fe-S protein
MGDGGGASRRAVLLGAGAAGAVGALAACGDNPGNSQQPVAATTFGDPVRVPIAFVPIGGGYIDFNRGVIVTQPEAGQFRGFEANCTHARCFITWVADGLIQCPCHGSQFRIADGSVARGPATRSLGTRTVSVDGDAVVVS